MKKRTIEIKCRGADELAHYQLTEYQGELKTLTKDNYDKLRKLILTQGFSEPIAVWRCDGNNFILNGHQRLRTVRQMEEEGFRVPKLPVVYVEAADHKEAKRKCLAMASQFGQVEGQGLYEFMIQSEIYPQELDDTFRLPEIKTDKFIEEYFDAPQPDVPDLVQEKFKLKITFTSEHDREQLFKELDERGYHVEVLP